MVKGKRLYPVLVLLIALVLLILSATTAWAKTLCPECGSSEVSGGYWDGCTHYEVCANCGYARYDFTSHDWYTVREPSCTECGLEKCRSCGTTQEFGSPLGHSYGSWTSYSTTQHVKTCSRCGDKVYGNHIDNNGDGICDTCGYIMHVHDYTDHYISHDDHQHEAYCTCSEHILEDHDFSYLSIDVNKHTKYCTKCGYSIEESHVDANGDYLCDECGGSLDIEPPTASHSLSITAWTNQDITIDLSATDNFSGVASIKKPDGSTVTGGSASFTLSENGTYSFIITDQVGNDLTYSVTVDNIDKEVSTTPEMKVITSNKAFGINLELLEHTLTDLSGFMKYQYSITCLSGTETVSIRATGTGETWQDLNREVIIESEGIYQVKIRAVSNTGNISEIIEYTIINDFTAPTAKLLAVGGTISIEAWDELSGIDRITLPDGSSVTADKAVFKAENSGTYTFTVMDKAGNEYRCSYDVAAAPTSLHTAFYRNPVVVGVSLSLLFLILILIIVLIVKHRKDQGYY